MSADVKAGITQQEIKDLVAHLTNFYYLQNLKYNAKSRCILVGILSILILSIKNSGWGGCLTDKFVKSEESYLSTVPNEPLTYQFFIYLVSGWC